MMPLFKKNPPDYQSSAKVVDGNLIISLPDAMNPIVWRMELGSVKASALEVRTMTDGGFMLSLKTPKGEVHDVAPFTSREPAVDALMKVSSALQNAHGKMVPFTAPAHIASTHPAQSHSAPENASAAGSLKWLIALAGVIIVIMLFSYLSSMTPTRSSETSPSSASGITGETNETSGVPESADKMLQGF